MTNRADWVSKQYRESEKIHIERMQRKASAKPSRKVIQIITASIDSKEFTNLLCLCDDGTVWEIYTSSSSKLNIWKQLPLVPQDDEETYES
jgi:hypothetical protein